MVRERPELECHVRAKTSLRRRRSPLLILWPGWKRRTCHVQLRHNRLQTPSELKISPGEGGLASNHVHIVSFIHHELSPEKCHNHYEIAPK